VSSVSSQEVTACFTLVSSENLLPASCFLRGFQDTEFIAAEMRTVGSVVHILLAIGP